MEVLDNARYGSWRLLTNLTQTFWVCHLCTFNVAAIFIRGHPYIWRNTVRRDKEHTYSCTHVPTYLFQQEAAPDMRDVPSARWQGSSHWELLSPSQPFRWPSPAHWHRPTLGQIQTGLFGSRLPCWRAVWAFLLHAFRCRWGCSTQRGEGLARCSRDQCSGYQALPER